MFALKLTPRPTSNIRVESEQKSLGLCLKCAGRLSAATKSPMSTFQPRKPAGSPQGGQFDSKTHATLPDPVNNTSTDIRNKDISGHYHDLDINHQSVMNVTGDINLHDATLTEVELREFSTNNTHVEGSTFNKVDIHDSFICNSTAANLTANNAYVAHTSLTKNQLTNVALNKSIFTSVDAHALQADNLTVTGGNFENTQFISSTVTDSHLNGSVFEDSWLHSADLTNTTMTDCTFIASNFNYTNMNNTTITGCTFTNTPFNHANLNITSMTDCSFTYCNFSRSTLEHVTLDGSTFSGTRFNIADKDYLTDLEAAGRIQMEGCTFNAEPLVQP